MDEQDEADGRYVIKLASAPFISNWKAAKNNSTFHLDPRAK